MQQFGIEGCGGVSGGVEALRQAAGNHHVDIMTTLAEAGVVDNGTVLVETVARGFEAAVKLLLQQKEEASNGQAAYLNFRGKSGFTPLLAATGYGGVSLPSPRIARFLVEAGADTSLRATPLELTTRMLREKKIATEDATEEQLHRVEGVRRLLLQEEAVHAVSFLWPVGMPFTTAVRTTEAVSRTEKLSTPLARMLPLLRQRARRPRVLSAALCRWVV